MYTLEETTKFKKDLKTLFKRDVEDFKRTFQTLNILKNKGVKGIPRQMRPHKLGGKYKASWECHIKPDVLIIWFQVESPNVIKLMRVGSHSDLF